MTPGVSIGGTRPPMLTRWTVTQAWPDGPRRLGTVWLDPEGTLSIDDAEPSHEGRLRMIVQTMNAAESLHVREVPPEDAGRYAYVTRMVRRSDPDFIAVLTEQLETYYDVTLDPA